MKSSDVVVGTELDPTEYNDLRSDILSWNVTASVEVTISSDAITFAVGTIFYRVDTESDAGTDNLDTISGGSEGNIIILIAEDITRVVTVKDCANIITEGDFALDAVAKAIILIKTSAGPWQEISRTASSLGGVDAGTIMLFDTSCPANWTRFTALDGLFPRGAASYGGTGGAANHSHTLTDIPEHLHAAGTLETDDPGGHTHSHTLRDTAGGSDEDVWDGTNKWMTTYYNTSSDGAHTHTLSGSTASTGEATTTDNVNNLPPYLEMIFCERD